MLTLQEISDRLEIQDVLARYSHAIDRHDWSGLDAVFTPDAVIDYTEFGGPRAALPEIKTFLQKVLPMHAGHYHLVATSLITVEGDTAEARSVCHNPMVLDRDDGRNACLLLRAVVPRSAHPDSRRMADPGAHGGEVLPVGSRGAPALGLIASSYRRPPQPGAG